MHAVNRLFFLTLVAFVTILLAAVFIRDKMFNSTSNTELFESLENGYTIVDMNMDDRGNYILISNSAGETAKYSVNSADYTKAYQMWKES